MRADSPPLPKGLTVGLDRVSDPALLSFSELRTASWPTCLAAESFGATPAWRSGMRVPAHARTSRPEFKAAFGFQNSTSRRRSEVRPNHDGLGANHRREQALPTFTRQVRVVVRPSAPGRSGDLTRVVYDDDAVIHEFGSFDS
jgi:hypothetical protein